MKNEEKTEYYNHLVKVLSYLLKGNDQQMYRKML